MGQTRSVSTDWPNLLSDVTSDVVLQYKVHCVQGLSVIRYNYGNPICITFILYLTVTLMMKDCTPKPLCRLAVQNKYFNVGAYKKEKQEEYKSGCLS